MQDRTIVSPVFTGAGIMRSLKRGGAGLRCSANKKKEFFSVGERDKREMEGLASRQEERG